MMILYVGTFYVDAYTWSFAEKYIIYCYNGSKVS